MNGIHDMGGMHGFGRVPYVKDAPFFAEPWEGRIFGITLALRPPDIPPEHHMRIQWETLPPIEYLRVGYYERWVGRAEGLLIGMGLATKEEVATGKLAPESKRGSVYVTLAQVPSIIYGQAPTPVTEGTPARFKVGDTVVSRKLNPVAHTRQPRYIRGRRGIIERDYGLSILQDADIPAGMERRQHLYNVKFSARELWGDQAPPHDSVHIDLWDFHLENAV